MRSHVGVLPKKMSDDNKKDVELVFLSKGSMKDEHRVQILDAAMKTKDMDNEHFLATVRSRLDRCAAHSVPIQQHPIALCLLLQYILHAACCSMMRPPGVCSADEGRHAILMHRHI